jgi:REP element-mobilizing transposase RayT
MPKVARLEFEERRGVAQALARFHGSKYRLHAWVAMDDHVHALLTPLEDFTLERIVRAWKSYTSRSINRQRGTVGALWQDEYFDRIVRDEAEFLEKSKYILGNPFKRWPELTEYPWAGVESD